jgi:hypothetical protein
LGFVSILCFGAVLATAGTIVNVVCRDILLQCRLQRIVNRPLLLAIFWGILWYLWMILIAAYSVYWWEQRLQLDFDIYSAYWFAFVSTTTIGLGDYYPPPEALFFGDQLVFSILFLYGFVWLAAFIGEFTVVLSKHVPNIGEKVVKGVHESKHKKNKSHKTKKEQPNEKGDNDNDAEFLEGGTSGMVLKKLGRGLGPPSNNSPTANVMHERG